MAAALIVSGLIMLFGLRQNTTQSSAATGRQLQTS
jgi:hypothetical protein